MNSLIVAAAQMNSAVGMIGENISKTLRVIHSASERNVRLIVFPELSLTGYDLPQLAHSDRWFSPEDDRLDALQDICAQLNVTAVVGAPVLMEGRRYLASLAIGPDRAIGVAPKTHLHGDEINYFESGTGPTMMSIDAWRVALAVCVDTAWPSHAITAAENGADLYAASVLYTDGEQRKLDVRMAARAVDHRMYSLAANTGGHPLGQRSAGGSAVWAPDGTCISRATTTDDELVIVNLAPRL
jgi:predicted amidohydrolase